MSVVESRGGRVVDKFCQLPPEVLVLGAVALDLMSYSIFKIVTDSIGVAECIFIRSCGAIVLLSVIIWLQSGKIVFPKTERKFVLLRAILGGVSILLFIKALSMSAFSSAVSLFYTGPIFAILFARFLYKTSLNTLQISAVLGSIGGCVLTLVEGGGITFHLSSAFVLLAASLYGLSLALTRKIQQTPILTTLLVYNGVCLLMTSGFVDFGSLEIVSTNNLSLISMTLVFNLLMNGLYIKAYRDGCVATLPIFDYAAIPLSFVVGAVLWNEIPSLQGLIGATLIVMSGVCIVLAKRRLVNVEA